MGQLQASQKMYEALKLLEPFAALAGKHSDEISRLAKEALSEYEHWLQKEDQEWHIDDNWRLREPSERPVLSEVPGMYYVRETIIR